MIIYGIFKFLSTPATTATPQLFQVLYCEFVTIVRVVRLLTEIDQ
jgi:hypothetical protein